MKKSNDNRVDKELAEELILHVCHKMENCSGFGSVVLNKALYFIDHAFYVKSGRTLTGFKYIKQQFGPTPKPSEFLPIRDALIERGKLTEKTNEYFGKQQKRLFANERANVVVFTPQELELIDSVIGNMASHDGRSVSDVSHDELSWKMAGMMEELPPYAYLLTESELDQKDLDWATKGINDYSSNVHKRT